MRALANSLLVVSALSLCACASFGKKPPPPPAPEESLPENLPPKPDDGTKRIENNEFQPPKKKGFLSKFLGADSDVPNAGPCPAVRVLYDASRFVEITGENKFENVGFTGEIQNVNSSCRYIGADPISINMSIDMALGKGPKAQGDEKIVNYWIAVTRADIVPIEKRDFKGQVFFPQGTDRMRFTTPNVNIEIPRRDKETSGTNFEILVGFELTPEQLEFNRNGIRFKIDAGTKK